MMKSVCCLSVTSTYGDAQRALEGHKCRAFPIVNNDGWLIFCINYKRYSNCQKFVLRIAIKFSLLNDKLKNPISISDYKKDANKNKIKIVNSVY